MIQFILSGLSALRKWCFDAPYYGVPWLVWFYVIFCIACYPHGGVFAGYLTGYDDPVRMTQVLNWVNGADWYDRRIMRVDPPDGFQTIWSRLVDMPIALAILISQQFVAQKTAALIAAFVVPLVELRLLFEAARYFVRPLVGKNTARLISILLIFTTISNYHNFSVSGFYPGEASHHPWYIILVTVLFGALARITMSLPSRKPIIMAGFAIGLLMAVGIEPFPLMAGACALLTLISWHYNRSDIALRTAQAFGGGAFFGFALLILHRPPHDFFTVSFVEPSILGPILIGAAGLFSFVSSYCIQRMARYGALTGIVLLSIITGSILLVSFPQMLDGAAAGLSPAERAMAHREHIEARALYYAANNFIDLTSLFLPLLLAACASLWCVIKTRSPRRQPVVAFYAGFSLIGSAMAQLFSRYYHHAVVMACGWLLWLWKILTRCLPQNVNYHLFAVILFIAIGPFGMWLMPAILHNSPIDTHILLFPAKLQSAREPCGLVEMGEYLDKHYGAKTILMVPGVDSSRLLFNSQMTIDFLNNYPSQDRFIDNETFFGTQLPDVAKEIARRHKIDLVLVCRIASNLMPLAPGEEPMMFERLEAGQPPSWLKRIETQTYGLYRLYEVDKAALH